MKESRRVELLASYWDEVYRSRGAAAVSWYEAAPETSLRLIDALAVPRDAPVIDVGGGASLLVDRLLAGGWSDVTVLDVSPAALRAARERVGASARVEWLLRDLLEWEPEREYALWHDRAVFHFLVERARRKAYRERLDAALAPRGAVVVGAFAPDGPERCSGLPVVRYSAEELAAALGPRFAIVEARREVHVTPSGAEQPFTWIAARASQLLPLDEEAIARG